MSCLFMPCPDAACVWHLWPVIAFEIGQASRVFSQPIRISHVAEIHHEAALEELGG